MTPEALAALLAAGEAECYTPDALMRMAPALLALWRAAERMVKEDSEAAYEDLLKALKDLEALKGDGA